MRNFVAAFCMAVAAVALQGCAGAGTATSREDPRVKPALKFNPNVIEQPGEISYDVFGTTPEAIRASLSASDQRLDGRRVLGSHSYWISYRLPMKQIMDGLMAEMRDERTAWDANPANRSAPFLPGARRPPPGERRRDVR